MHALDLVHRLRSTQASPRGRTRPLWYITGQTATARSPPSCEPPASKARKRAPGGLRYSYGVAVVTAGVPLPTGRRGPRTRLAHADRDLHDRDRGRSPRTRVSGTGIESNPEQEVDMAASRSEALGRTRATYQDVLDTPPHQVAEIIDGTLHTHPRPAVPHTRASSVLGRKIGTPYDDDTTGPDGWWILDEPELHLGDDVLVPDLAGWRRERMPELPDAAYVTVAPDWACEVLSASTRRVDLQEKRPVYAREGRRPPLAHRPNRPDARGIRTPPRRVGAHRLCKGRRSRERATVRLDHVQPGRPVVVTTTFDSPRGEPLNRVASLRPLSSFVPESVISFTGMRTSPSDSRIRSTPSPRRCSRRI